MVLERLRHVFVSAAGLKFDGRTIDSSSFQRIGRKLKVVALMETMRTFFLFFSTLAFTAQ